MSKQNNKYLILFAVLIIAGLVSLWVNNLTKRPATNIDLSLIPFKVDGWAGKEIPIEASVSAILETDSVIMREYKKGADAVSLAIVYYKDSKVALHLPESCLSGQGSRLTEVGEDRIDGARPDSFPVTKLVTTNKSGNLLILYYFKTGELRTNSYQDFRLAMMMSRIRGIDNGGALVRFAVPINHLNKDNKLKALKSFISVVDPVLSKYLI